MVEIPKVSKGLSLAVGKFVRLSTLQEFKNNRCRIGVLVSVDGKDTWFNDYGTEEEIKHRYDPVGVGDEVNIEYTERHYTTRDGRSGVARDIKSFSRKGKVLSEKDLKEFMPESEINIGLLVKDLNTVGNIINHWRGVLSGEKENT